MRFNRVRQRTYHINPGNHSATHTDVRQDIHQPYRPTFRYDLDTRSAGSGVCRNAGEHYHLCRYPVLLRVLRVLVQDQERAAVSGAGVTDGGVHHHADGWTDAGRSGAVPTLRPRIYGRRDRWRPRFLHAQIIP